MREGAAMSNEVLCLLRTSPAWSGAGGRDLLSGRSKPRAFACPERGQLCAIRGGANFVRSKHKTSLDWPFVCRLPSSRYTAAFRDEDPGRHRAQDPDRRKSIVMNVSRLVLVGFVFGMWTSETLGVGYAESPCVECRKTALAKVQECTRKLPAVIKPVDSKKPTDSEKEKMLARTKAERVCDKLGQDLTQSCSDGACKP